MRKILVFAALGFVFFNLLACENAWKSPVKQTNSNETTTASSPTVSVPTQTNFNPENLLAYQKAKIDEQLALINSLKISLKDVYPRVSVDFIKNSPRPFSLIENAANVEWEEFDAATTEYISNVEEILVNDYTRIDTNKIDALVLMAKKTWPILSQQLRADFSEYNKTQAKIFILDLHISTLHTFLRNKKIDIRHDKFDILFSPAETPLVVGQPFYVDLNLVGVEFAG